MVPFPLGGGPCLNFLFWGLAKGFFVIKNYKIKMNKESIGRLVEEKMERLPDGVSILGPDSSLAPEIQADWLVDLLSRMYVQHGITKNWERLWLDIVGEDCKLWFAVRDGLPIASAALIKQTDGSVEIGRAVSLLNGVGGLLMLSAVIDHLSHSDVPLVAEVRISDQFLGIPSGEATQVVCFRHLGLDPRALVPAFNHGEPNRQEMFLFSSSEKIAVSAPLILPENRMIERFIRKTALAIAANGFEQVPEVLLAKEELTKSKWGVVFQEPFSLVIPEKSGLLIRTVVDAVEEVSPFMLAPVPADGNHVAEMLDCLTTGFIPCGFDRNPDKNGHPVILFGKLRSGTRLAPIKIVSGVFTPQVEAAINEIDQMFR